MKRVFVSIGLFLLCSAAAVGETGVAATPTLASFLSSLGAGGCPTPGEAASRGALGGGFTEQTVTCTADCGEHADVSCSTSGACSAVDRNCSAGQPGYVECNGAYTYCPPCPCPEGATRYEDGGCCSGGRQRTWVMRCINGSWEHTSTLCGGSCF